MFKQGALSFIDWLGTVVATIIGGIFLILLYGITLWLVVGALSAIQVRDSHDERQFPFTFNEEDAETARNYVSENQDEVRELLFYVEFPLVDEFWEVAGELQASFPDIIPLEVWQNSETPDEFMQSNGFLQVQNKTCARTEEFVLLGCNYVSKLAALRIQLEEDQSSQKTQSLDLEEQALKQLEALQVYTEFVDLYDFMKFYGLLPFLEAPREILVMVLTIVMGVLGSVITMTWTFVRRDNNLSIRRFLLMPFVGGMSAFIILIFFKAGQLTLTAGESNDVLSPFFLSFVGIISGLLSERAYARMSEVGHNFFTVTEERMRWGIHLEQQMEQAGLSLDDIMHHLEMGEKKAKLLMSGKAPATIAQQKLIAANLRRDLRELFTDVPPAEAMRSSSGDALAEQPE